MEKYTQEQIKDIKERELKALEMLKELKLTPAAQIYKVNMGNDTFGDRLIPYLQDTKYDISQESNKEDKKSVETK